jgi:4-amino-4-deoxy-L-arabinose transferase-like glycosyltransferase
MVMAPVLCVVLLVLFALGRCGSLRMAVVYGFLVGGGLLVAITELLAGFDCLTAPCLAVAWGVALAGVLVLFLYDHRAIGRRLGKLRRAVPIAWKRWDRLTRVCLLAVAGIVLLTGVLGLMAPPNNADAMCLYSARVVNWIHQGNVDYHPAQHAICQYQPPLHSYALLHLQVLSGDDILANLPQWFSFLIIIVVVSRITARLGGSGRAQAIAALLAATLPVGILQSTSVQSNLSNAAFLLCFVLFFTRVLRRVSLAGVIWAGLSAGLALLTKGYAYPYGLFVGASAILAYGSQALRQKQGPRLAAMAGAAVAVILIAAVLNTGYYLRNVRLLGSILPASESGGQFALPNSLPEAAWRIGQHGWHHLRTPWDLYLAWRARTTGQVDWNRLPLVNEDTSGNFPHMVLALILPVVALWGVACSGKRKNRRTDRSGDGSVLAASLGLCLVLIVIGLWTIRLPNDWVGRWHTFAFLVMIPLLAWLGEDVLRNRRWVEWLVAGLLVLYVLPFLLLNPWKPLLPGYRTQPPIWSISRDRRRFYGFYRYETFQTIARMAERIGCRRLGIVHLLGGSWEYPFWVLLDSHAGQKNVRLVPVLPAKKTNPTDQVQPLPPLIVLSRIGQDTPEMRALARSHLLALQNRLDREGLPSATYRIDEHYSLLFTGSAVKFCPNFPPASKTGPKRSARSQEAAQ